MDNRTITKYRPIKIVPIVPPEGRNGGYLRQLDILFDTASEVKGYIADQRECHEYLVEEVTLNVRETTYSANDLR